MNHKSIEDILLQKDKRGIASLRQYLPTDYASQTAKYLLQNLGPTVITTGFYILYGGTVETDGPLGAKAIGNALETLGQKVIYLTDHYCKPIMDALASPTEQTIEFPLTDADKSTQFAREFLRDIRPSLLISIERCSPSSDGIYRNMLSKDVSGFTAKIDKIFDIFPHSIGIGDGGNEIGMGKLQAVIPNHPKLPQKPAATVTNQLLISSVSNWGGWGLVAGLSNITGRNLLPTIEEEQARLRKCVEFGLVDGITGEVKPSVDGFSSDEYTIPLQELHQFLET